MSDERPWHTFDSEGRCIAWRHSLPPGTLVCFAPDRPVWNVAPLPPSPNALVIVVAWPDGSPPEAPEPAESWFNVECDAGHSQVAFDEETGQVLRAYADDRNPECAPHRLMHIDVLPGSVIRQEVKP